MAKKKRKGGFRPFASIYSFVFVSVKHLLEEIFGPSSVTTNEKIQAKLKKKL